MLRQVASFLFVIVACTVASAQAPDNVIYQHNPDYNDPNTPGYPFYTIWSEEQQITIHRVLPGEVFEFEAVLEENNQYVGPGDINLVTADENAGRVDLTFVGHNGHPWGAADIKEIRLNQPGVTGVIRELHIANNLGDLGPIRAARIEGNCFVGNEITDDVYLDSLLGELRCQVNMRNLTISDPKPGSVGARIVLGEGVEDPETQAYEHQINVAGPVEYLGLRLALGGRVSIGGDLTNCSLYGIPARGELHVGGDVHNLTFDPVLSGPADGRPHSGGWELGRRHVVGA